MLRVDNGPEILRVIRVWVSDKIILETEEVPILKKYNTYMMTEPVKILKHQRKLPTDILEKPLVVVEYHEESSGYIYFIKNKVTTAKEQQYTRELIETMRNKVFAKQCFYASQSSACDKYIEHIKS